MGIVLTFRKKYFWGFILTAIAMALEIGANHFQMTYYFMLLVLVLGVAYLIDAIKKKKVKHFFISTGLLIAAVILGVSANATSIMATKEYADWSTRGKSVLTINPDGSPKENIEGLDKEYITQYSYGIVESLNLFVPRLFGGSNNEDLGTESKAYEYLVEQGLPRTRALEFSSALPLYWGNQPGVAAPAYIGAIVIFLFVLGLFLVKGRLKWWLLGGTLLSLFLSWGKNFGLLTDFMIDYFPLYNKFRAVSSIQVIVELCAPVLAVMALAQVFKPSVEKSKKLRALKMSFLIVIAIGIGLFLIKSVFDFSGLNDSTYQKYFGDEVMTMIKRDREAVYVNDTIRSLIYVFLAALAIWLYLKGRVKQNLVILTLALLVVFDLVGIDQRYVNKKDFDRQKRMNQPFQQLSMDKQIAQDKGVFRVYDPSEGLNGARTSYFHQSIGGYHAAKPAGMQDLFDFHIYKNNLRVLNMLNVKYIIQQDEEGEKYALANPEANGNAWFIRRLIEVQSSDEEIMALDSLDVLNEAVVNTNDFTEIDRFNFPKDSLASISLTEYRPNHLKYSTNNENDGLAVFSEMYYPVDWKAYIDGKLVDHIKVNYVLRALNIPAGSHTVEFKFEPKVIETGSKITLASSILMIILFLGGGVVSIFRWRKKEEG